MLSRRTLLSASALGGAAVIAGCAVTKSNGVTTIKLNVAQANAWAQAILNAVTLVAGLPGIVGTPAAMAVMAVEPLISADITAFNKAVNGQLELSYDATSIPAAVTSIASDGQKLVTAVQAAIGNVASSQLATAQTYLAAVRTVVSFFQAAAGSVAASATGMTEAQALKALHAGN